MTKSIHPTAVLDDHVVCEDGVVIGPYCVLTGHIHLGAGTELKSHVTISGHVKLGQSCVVHPFTAIGGPPQDLGYRGEPTCVEIGDRADIREHVTVHRASTKEDGITKIGNDCLLMTTAHVGHDCSIGHKVIISSGAALGGHVRIGERTIIGGNTSVHQFVRIGEGAMIGGHAAIDRDIIPFGMAFCQRASLEGLNLIGLKRSGAQKKDIVELRRFYGDLFDPHGEGSFTERLELAEVRYAGHDAVTKITAFIREERKRPLTHPAG